SPGFFHDNRLPYAEHYSLSIQRQFGANTLLNLAYVGTQGHRLLSDLESNPADPALCLSVSQSSQVRPSPVDGSIATCGPNGENHKLGKAISAFDMTHNFVASYSYELPFDKLAAGSYPRLTRGWILTGVTRFTTGLPIRIRENDDRSLLGTRFTGPTGQGID